jgi:molybdate transport system substrate-binding protein
MAALAGLVACGGGRDAGNGSILVVAAADLRFAFDEIEKAFEGECRCRVEITFGSSGAFAAQIEQGLPADVFFSADTDYVRSLESRGLIIEGSARPYASGRIVLAKNRRVEAKLETPRDLLAPAFRRIAIANPAHAPYGVAAREVLVNAAAWDLLQPRLVLGESAFQAAQFIETGDAQGGIIPLSLAIGLGDKLDYVLIDRSQHAPLRQAAGVVRRSRNPGLARSFVDFVCGPRGREILARYGFEAAED